MERRQMLIPAGMLVSIAAASLILGRGDVDRAESALVTDTVVTAAGDTIRGVALPEDVTRFLENGQFWRAARSMRAHLSGAGRSDPESVLLAARAEAGWGGWRHVREYLEGAEWLSDVGRGEGWYWLGRAYEETDAPAPAMRAYAEYLRASAGTDVDLRTVAELRRGLILLRHGSADEGALVLETVRNGEPAVARWIDLLAAEALAQVGDTARVRRLTDGADGTGLWLRARRARIEAHREAGDHAGAARLARSYAGAAGAAAARAELSMLAAEAFLAARDTAAARADLRATMDASPGSSHARRAADIFPRTGAVSADDRLAIATSLDRTGADARAAADYRSWLDANVGSASERAEVRLRLASALFDAGEYANAINAARPLADAAGSTGASAMYLTGRSEYRRGNKDRAFAIWIELADRHPGSGPGSEGLFLVADLSHDDGNTAYATQIYRRVAADFRGTDRAGLSLMRLGGIAFTSGDYRAAAEAWGTYTTTYPTGERWHEATYWRARSLEALGDVDSANTLYREIRRREPLSYYALRGAERSGDAFWPIDLAPSPNDDPATDERVTGWMRGIDLLLSAGLYTEAEAQADRWIEAAGNDPVLLYPLAEALIDRGLTVRGIRIGLRLENASGRMNERLLRILYPFPYRPMMTAEAREKGLDPFVVAALTRQESLFKARITSPAGARGLMQIMPETGAALARGIRIGEWDPELLYQPEINAHLGTTYLAEQMEKYDGSLPAVFSAYNAGPHRIDRWMRIFPEWADAELFTERIPYRETRDYVKILTRNIALYRALYG